MIMKKFVLMIMFAAMSCMTFAQEAIETSKWYDNISVGIGGGVATPLNFNSVFPLNTIAGVRIQKDFTPMFGLQAEGTAILNDNNFTFAKTTVKGTNVGINGVLNLFNIFKGYNGTPRTFEVNTVAGLGWLHEWETADNLISAKTGLDLAFNLGKKKAHSIVITPAIYWNLNKWNAIQFNKNNAQLSLMASYVYHFKTSNGTHHFKIYDIGAMIDEIIRLNDELAKKPNEVVRTEIQYVPTENTIRLNTNYVVMFAKGSSELSEAAIEVLNTIPAGSEVNIIATASPEGTERFNKALSQDRANVVAEYLTSKGIKVTYAAGLGVQGETSNRVAIVTIQ